MKVFLSWSGETSRTIAQALRRWLPAVIQEIDPFMSDHDIDAGARWQQRISEELEGTSFGILCVTRENQAAPWLNFEAGAIAKEVDNSRVVPLAIDLTPADVKPPLGLFQAKPLSRIGVLGILDSINAHCERPLGDLNQACEVWWPQLEPALDVAKTVTTARPVRSDRDLLEEILITVRTMNKRRRSPSAPDAVLDIVTRYKERWIEAQRFEVAAAARDIERALVGGTIAPDEALPRLVAIMTRANLDDAETASQG